MGSVESNIAREIIDFLVRENKSIAVAESCTGGLINYAFSQISGASSAFRGGIVCYQNAIKTRVLGVDSAILAQKSAYSVEVVDLMLMQISKIMQSDFVIATSGIAGPNGGSDEMPVGTIFVGVKKRNEKSIIKKVHFNGTRIAIQTQTTQYALDLFKSAFIK
ncbi:CinA family protein [Helicobacter sp. 23-1044]